MMELNQSYIATAEAFALNRREKPASGAPQVDAEFKEMDAVADPRDQCEPGRAYLWQNNVPLDEQGRHRLLGKANAPVSASGQTQH